MKGRILVEELLEEIKKENGHLPSDLHVTRMCGALVAISNGEVIHVTDTEMRYCPLSSSLYDGMGQFEEHPELFKPEISKTVGSKISRFGHFTKARELCRMDVAIPFGASEMIMYALDRKGADAAVTVCDGAGTVVTGEPSLVQGIGARMNGLFYTSPIKQVIETIQESNGYVVNAKTAEINQILGVNKAVELGHRRIVVTINGFAGEDLAKVRCVEKETESYVTILAVCTTGVEKERAEEILKYADLVWSCASLHVRDIIGKEARLQIGVKIPVFVLTRKGIDFVSHYSTKGFEDYIKEGKRYVIVGHPKLTSNIHDWKKIRMGNFKTYLAEIDELPLRVEDEPRPLL